MQELKCLGCEKIVACTDDDEFPRCEECQGRWMEVVAHGAIMDGEMDHLIGEEYDVEED
jgi:hypothetical protein